MAVCRDVMTREPACCEPTDPNGALQGIIAQADIATRVHRDKTTGELVEAISEPGTSRR